LSTDLWKTMSYRPRIVESELDELRGSLPAIAIEGAKAVGKTALASRGAKTIYELDDPNRLALAEADPRRLLGAEPPVLIDEWQRLPQIWDLVRRAVDQGADPGQYLLTGSVSPDGLGTHSGAGRIPVLRLRPLALAERIDEMPTISLAELLKGRRPELGGETAFDLENYTDEILASGFPGLRDLSGRPLRAQLDGYLARIVDREFAELGHELRNPARLRRWMEAYAAASSSTASFEKIRNAATDGSGEIPTRKGVLPYRDVLRRLWVLDPVDGWLPTRSRLSKLAVAQKHQLVDPALAGRLVGATKTALLDGDDLGPPVPRDGTFLGALFESLMTLSVRVYAQAAEAQVKHLRTHRGDHEIDLIVERGDGRVVAIEIKLGPQPRDEDLRHLKWLRNSIGEDLLDAIVVTTGPSGYRREDGIGVVPAALLGP
jgi:predicted AAA+ superfamily ATPase